MHRRLGTAPPRSVFNFVNKGQQHSSRVAMASSVDGSAEGLLLAHNTFDPSEQWDPRALTEHANANSGRVSKRGPREARLGTAPGSLHASHDLESNRDLDLGQGQTWGQSRDAARDASPLSSTRSSPSSASEYDETQLEGRVDVADEIVYRAALHRFSRELDTLRL